MQIFTTFALIASCLLAPAMASEDGVLQYIKNLIEEEQLEAEDQSGPHMSDPGTMGDGDIIEQSGPPMGDPRMMGDEQSARPIGDREQQVTSQGVNGGVIYTRWGKSSCPSVKGTGLVYSGITGGTLWSQTGGGANYLCMPRDAQYSAHLTYRPGYGPNSANGFAGRVYGAEYERPIKGTHNTDVPCAVCHVSSRQAVLMIPAKCECPSSWTREYFGYLMTEYEGTPHDIRGPTMFECVDKDQEAISHSTSDKNGAVFYHTEAANNGQLPSPPYVAYKELNCVVCTK